MLGVVMVLGFMFGFMIMLGVLGWAVEKVAQRKATDIVEECAAKQKTREGLDSERTPESVSGNL